MARKNLSAGIFFFVFLLTLFVSSALYLLFGLVFKKAILFHLALSLISLMFCIVLGGVRQLSNAFSELKGHGSIKLQRILTSVLSLLCFLLLFYLIQTRYFYQIDLTEESVNTLSEQSHEVLAKLNKPIVAKYFMRGAGSLKGDQELLKRYNSYSKKFLVTSHDLDKDRPLADALGIKELNSVYLGYEDEVVNPDKQAAKGIIESGGLSEEKITNALLKLVRAVKPVVYFSKGHGEGSILDEADSGFSFLKDAFESDGFIVQELDYEVLAQKPAEKSLVVFLSCPKDLLPREYENLRTYVNSGGGILALLEPRQSSNLNTFFSEYGFLLGNDTIVGEERYTNGGAALGVQPIISKFSDHPSLRGFSKSIVVSAAMSVRKKADADHLLEIAFTDENTWAETNLKNLYSKTPEAKKEESDLVGPVSMSAVSDGSLIDMNSSFKDRKSKSRIAVIGDLDLVANVNLYQLFNRDYILNIANWIVGEEEHISIRTGTIRKSKKIISEDEYSKIFLVAGLLLPEVILILGYFILRRKEG